MKALEVLFQDTDLYLGAVLTLGFLLRWRAEGLPLLRRARDWVHTLVDGRGARGCLIGRLSRGPRPLWWAVVAILSQSLRSSSTRGTDAAEGPGTGDTGGGIPSFNAIGRGVTRFHNRSLGRRRGATASSGC